MIRYDDFYKYYSRSTLEISENLIIFAVMKHSQIFRQYIWIINTLRSCGGLTFEELNQKWKAEDVSRGKPLQRSSFNRHRDAILEMFGIIIDCDLRTYKYYIGNQEALEDDSLERWIYSTLTVHGALSEGASVKERLVLENAPAGERYLDMMIHAIRCNHRLRIGYQKFQAEGYEKTVCPYALKLFRQRWYLLARNDEDQMRIYALDRITSLCLTEETFEMPADFSAQKYFSERSANCSRRPTIPISRMISVPLPISWANSCVIVLALRCLNPWNCVRK